MPEFAIGSSTRTDVVVTQAGRIGIGTTSPVAALDIENSANTTSAGYEAAINSSLAAAGGLEAFANGTSDSALTGFSNISGSWGVIGQAKVSGAIARCLYGYDRQPMQL